MTDKQKPFYLRPPWEILFKEEAKLEKISPWSINLVHLLTTLLEEMNRVGIDFRAAGTAINSSVLIYLKKAELLLMMEEPPQEPQEKGEVYLPPPLSLPFRFELTTTSISDLIAALDKALSDDNGGVSRQALPTLPMPIPDFVNLEAYLLEIEGRSEALLEKIRSTPDSDGPLRFTALVNGMGLTDVIRVFMMLLFLAQREQIELDQDEEETDIVIKILGDKN